MQKHIAPAGTWKSPITADLVAGKNPKISEPSINQDRIFWIESRPEEKGRNAIMMYKEGQSQCILPHPLSAKSRVHEYGGGSYAIYNDTLYFVLADDQQIYRVNFSADSFEPEALTDNTNLRFADLHFDKTHRSLYAICEDHTQSSHEPKNTLVKISCSNRSNEPEVNAITIVHQGFDFYSFPRVSPNGKYLSWSCWNHPDMPWDNTELWLAQITDTDSISGAKKIVGNGNESIFQPQWSPDNTLYFVSDRDNWWNIYQYNEDQIQPITHKNAEFATPQWTFNMSTYGFLNNDKILATYTQNGQWKLCEVTISSRKIKNLDCASTEVFGIYAEDNQGVFIGASPTLLLNVFHYSTEQNISPLIHRENVIETAFIAEATNLSFSTEGGDQVHAFYYPPCNKHFRSDTPPPMIVICHGGPTGATSNGLDLKNQYWTTRGFAVMDVNYRGSTGYGRAYRHSLHNNWGIYDVDDVCAAALYAEKNNLVAKGQSIIKGSSAGGYTVLAALAFKDTFHCGVSLYGIGDLETLAKDTHKFEARYLDTLIGPYPQEKSLYQERSPIHFIHDIKCPIAVFQGLEDKVVPPNQAEEMVKAVDKNTLPVTYITFENEGHGFRQAENIDTMLSAELEFYIRVFKLGPSNKNITIKNLSE